MVEENVIHPQLEKELALVQAVYGKNALEIRYYMYIRMLDSLELRVAICSVSASYFFMYNAFIRMYMCLFIMYNNIIMHVQCIYIHACVFYTESMLSLMRWMYLST